MRFSSLAIISLVTFLLGCLDHLDPREDRARFAQEQKTANAPKLLLEEGGVLPDLSVSGQPAAQVVVDGDVLFSQFCSSCHGADGAANNATAAVMNPKPRNLTDRAWQNSVDNEHIAKVIREGGTAVGLSATMPPWGAQLNGEQLAAVVAKVRSLAK